MEQLTDKKENHFVGRSKTPNADKDLWQTPRELFDSLDREFNFNLDACASKGNNLVKNYLTEHMSALEYEWVSKHEEIKSVFINPPYSQTEVFLNRASEQAIKHNITVVALVNANTDTKWFSDAVKTANEVRLITGRIGFSSVNGKKSCGNTKGQCLIIWRGNCKQPCNITLVNREDLK